MDIDIMENGHEMSKRRRFNQDQDPNQGTDGDPNMCPYCRVKCRDESSSFSKLTCQGCKSLMHTSCYGLRGSWLKLYEETLKKGKNFPFTIFCPECLQDVKVKNDQANNWRSGGLNPFLIDNVVDVLVKYMSNRTLLNTRSICKFWNEKALNEMCIRKNGNNWPIKLNTTSLVQRFTKMYSHIQTPRTPTLFQSFAIENTKFFNSFVNCRSGDFFSYLDVKKLVVNCKENNFKKTTSHWDFGISPQIFEQTVWDISWSIVSINLDFDLFNCWPFGYDDAYSWRRLEFHRVKFPHLKEIKMKFPTTDFLDYSTKFKNLLKIFTLNADNLESLKISCDKDGVFDSSCLPPTLSAGRTSKLSQLKLSVKSVVTRSSRITTNLIQLVADHKLRLKSLTLSCKFLLEHNDLVEAFSNLEQFLQTQSASLEVLHLSLYYNLQHARKEFEIPRMPKLTVLKLSDGKQVLRTTVAEHAYRYGAEKVDLSSKFPLLNTIEIKRNFDWRVSIKCTNKCESVTTLKMNTKQYHGNERIDKLFPNVETFHTFYDQNVTQRIKNFRKQKIYPSDSTYFYFPRAHVKYLVLKLTTEELNLLNFATFQHFSGLKSLTIINADAKDVPPAYIVVNLNPLKKLKELVLIAFKYYKMDTNDFQNMISFFPNVDYEYLTIDENVERKIPTPIPSEIESSSSSDQDMTDSDDEDTDEDEPVPDLNKE